MHKAQHSGVQGVTRHYLEAIFDKLLILREGCSLQNLIATISLVVEQRMTYILHMNTNLMRTSRFESALNQRHIAVASQHFVVCYGVLTLRAIGKDLHLVAITRITTDIARNRTLVIRQITPNQRHIATTCSMLEELA